ncbi:MAG: hypothetical protein E7448_01035 [Ruminococcaceae bacterium]|nr:hypothetical protein [Oscillospiraceae bacterium]
MRRLILFFLVITLVLPCIPGVLAKNDTIILSITGDLAAALDAVADGGTIQIQGRYNIPKGFVWENHGKRITITGGVLSFQENNEFSLGDHVRFENITLQFADDGNLYANGFDLYLDTDVKVSGKANLYGGGRIAAVSGTSMTLLGGTFLNVYGGGNSGKVDGDVHLVIGGNFNKNMGSISHSHEYQVYGGGNNCIINGNVYLTFGGNAKANYIYGGCVGKNSRIGGHIRLAFNGGKAMSICGGSRDINQQCDIHLSFTGGEVQQIFGGCEKSSMIGNILLNITGGTVTRRIYGGCYNNYDFDGWHATPNYVHGEILLVLGENVDLAMNYGSDESIYAHSRQATIPAYEVSHLVFTSTAAQAKHTDKLGAQDRTMKGIMEDTKISDDQHVLTHSVRGNSIVQNCSQHDSAKATISVDSGIYTGQALENVTVTVSENWLGPVPAVEYSNNTKVGFATATVTFGDAVVEVSFLIWPPIWVCIIAGAVLLLIAGGITAFLIIRKKKAAT